MSHPSDGPRIAEIGAGPRLLLVHGSFARAEDTFVAQRELADTFRLVFVTRRGFHSDSERVDWEADAADLVELLDEPAHVVGHSYGGLGCLLASARVPEQVRSLTVIEPPAFSLLPDDPDVARLVASLRAVFAQAGEPADIYADFVAAFGFPRPTRVPPRLAPAVRASARERGPWEAVLPLGELRRAGFPKLVVTGDWQTLPEPARSVGGVVFNRVADTLATAIAADRLTVANAGHYPHTVDETVNLRLRALLPEAAQGAVVPSLRG